MMRSRAARWMLLAVATVMIAWGLRLIVIEGLLYAWPRHFAGDFSVIMTGGQWNGQGIVYGPIVVIERWLVDTWPSVVTIRAFAVVNVALLAVAFACCARAARLSSTATIVAMALWLCYWRLFYAVSVAANPEILEVALLSAAWLAASRDDAVREGAFIAGAALTKLIPWVFMLRPIMRRSSRAIAAAAVVAAVVIAIVAVGQRLSPVEAIVATFVPLNPHLAATAVNPESMMVRAGSTEFIGVYEAVARRVFSAPEMPMSAADLVWLRVIAASTLVATLLVAAFGVWRAAAATSWPVERRLAVMYAVLFSALPILTVYTHVHTFVLLLPIWTLLAAVLVDDGDRAPGRAWFVVFGVVCYVLTGFPQIFMVIDRVAGTLLTKTWLVKEPIVGNLLLVAGLAAYAARVAWVRAPVVLAPEARTTVRDTVIAAARRVG